MTDGNENDNPAQVVGEVADEIGKGLDVGAANIPEQEETARLATETTADVAQVVAGVARAVDAGTKLGEAVAAGDEGRIVGSAGTSSRALRALPVGSRTVSPTCCPGRPRGRDRRSRPPRPQHA